MLVGNGQLRAKMQCTSGEYCSSYVFARNHCSLIDDTVSLGIVDAAELRPVEPGSYSYAGFAVREAQSKRRIALGVTPRDVSFGVDLLSGGTDWDGSKPGALTPDGKLRVRESGGFVGASISEFGGGFLTFARKQNQERLSDVELSLFVEMGRADLDAGATIIFDRFNGPWPERRVTRLVPINQVFQTVYETNFQPVRPPLLVLFRSR